MTQFCTIRMRPAMNLTPARLLEPTGPPSICRPRRTTMQFGSVAQLTVTPLVPATRIPASPMPSLASVIALVTVTAPKPPGSSVSISPPAAVLEIAPGKVLQGAVREHGLTSSPTPEIQVRVACARCRTRHQEHGSACQCQNTSANPHDVLLGRMIAMPPTVGSPRSSTTSLTRFFSPVNRHKPAVIANTHDDLAGAFQKSKEGYVRRGFVSP